MSDATLVAQEIQDVASSITDVAAAVQALRDVAPPTVNVNVPELAPPTVNVNVPELAPPTVNVNVPEALPPVVNVAPSSARVENTINVQRVLPSAYSVRITERDENGFIESFTITPL